MSASLQEYLVLIELIAVAVLLFSGVAELWNTREMIPPWLSYSILSFTQHTQNLGHGRRRTLQQWLDYES